MADEQPPNPASSGSPEKADSDSASGATLDDVLAEAASLASDLSEDVGTPEGPLKSATRNVEPGSGSDIAEDLDAELANLERLVGDASSQVDPQTDPQDSQPNGTAPEEVPDFMSDLTGPSPTPEEAGVSEPSDSGLSFETTAQDASDDATGEAGHAEESPGYDGGSTKPGASGTDVTPADAVSVPSESDATSKSSPIDAGTPGVVGNIPRSAQISTKTDHVPSLEADVPAGDAEGGGGPKGLRDRGLQVLMTLGERGVTMLEVADRPTAKLGTSARQIIGWAALATLGTALIVLLISLL